MSLRLLFSDMDKGCLTFVAAFFLIAFASLKLIEDLQTKLAVCGFCVCFMFAAFLLDSWIEEKRWNPQ